MRLSPGRIHAATALILLLFLITTGPASAGEPAGTDVSWTHPVTGISPDGTNLSFHSGPQGETVLRYPLMHFTPAQFKEMQQQHRSAPKYSAPFSGNILDNPPQANGSKSLLPYISYIPAEREQGNCGDCWVWAGTGALEIDHSVKNGINKRLSVQYFNSKYNNGTGSNWACCGGWISQFTGWYNADSTYLPWSNINAGFADGSKFCEDYDTSVPIGSISKIPHYSLNSLSHQSVDTFGISQTAAISNIKSALNANKSVVYSFWYSDAGGWGDFFHYWFTEDEDVLFNPDSHADETADGGHSVLITGYNDTVPGNEYWEVLNSWGTTAGRPHGLFRLKMYMNYSAIDFSYGEPYQQHIFEILDSDFPIEKVTVANFTANITSGTSPLPVSFTDQSLNIPTVWAWYFGDENFNGPWTEETRNAGWSARGAHSSVAVPDGSIVLMGGYYFTNDVWRSTDNGTTWTRVNSSAGWNARDAHSSVALPDGSIVLTGGWDNNHYKNDTWRSADNGATWTQVNESSGWSLRSAHGSVAMPDGSIVLMGGYDGSRYYNDTWRSVDQGATWTRLNASAGWPARYSHSSVAMPDGSIVLMGGTDSSLYPRNDTWRSTDNGAHWTRVNASSGWTARVGSGSVSLPDGSIILMGGRDTGGLKSDIWRSADNGAHWTLVNSSPGWTAREGSGSVALPDGSIVLMGGFDSTGMKNDVWRFHTAGSRVKNPVHTYTAPGAFRVSLQASNDFGISSTRKTGYISTSDVSVLPDKTGVYRPLTHVFYLDYNGNGTWNGASVDRQYTFGLTGDLPVTGDWDNNGKSEIGVFRNSTHVFYLDYNGNGAWNGASVDRQFNFGLTGDLPVTGDWNNDGISEIGAYRPSTHVFYLDYNGNGAWNGASVDRQYSFGLTGDLPVTGDWDNNGKDEIGVFRNSTHMFYLDYNGNGAWNGASIDRQYSFGLTGDLPVTGDWDNNEKSEIGVFRNSTHMFYLDFNGNGAWNGASVDRQYNFGLTGDKPVSGRWN